MTSNNIQTSGGIFTHHFIESLQQDSLNHPAVRSETFTFTSQSRLSERELEVQMAAAWADLVERWDAVEREFNSLDISALRQRWLKPLFQHFGFSLDFLKADLVLEEDFRFPISYLGRAEKTETTIPIHTVLYRVDASLETKTNSGRGVKALAPHDMMQRYLNLNKKHLWGIVTDGVYLRLLRDFYHTYTRGYTEFDLQGIFSSRDYAGFRAMYRLLHASRFVIQEGKETAPIDDLYEDALAMGVKVGDDLRTNVQAAIEALGNGFLTSSPGFMDQVKTQEDGAGQLYRDILMTIYRMLFLLFAEQRGMLPGRGSLYMEEFSLTAFRTLAEQPLSEDRNFDLWEKLKTTFSMVEHGVQELKIFAYNGALFSSNRTPLLTPVDVKQAPHCRNDYLLQTIRHLTTVEKEHVLQRISYSDLSVEEIGSIYESLLEITPRVTNASIEVDGRQIPANSFYLDPRGKGRKTTGSYYTPPSLVNELIKSALVPVMLDRIQAVVSGYDPDLVEVLSDVERVAAETALLRLKVVDPAAGSGAFLIAANNKLGLELARIRTGTIFPPEEDIRHARRDVLAHCIHGVDLNPMAVELCKVSLWINAAVEDAPLNFLDHHIQCGNSLVGATPAIIKEGIPNEAYNPVTGDDAVIASSLKRQNRVELTGQGSLALRVTAINSREDLSHFSEVRALAENNPGKAEKTYYAYWGSSDYWMQRLPFDLWAAAFFTPISQGNPVPTTHDMRQAMIDPQLVTPEKRDLARQLAEKHHFFHWHLAFPEVFTQEGKGGFDVVLGNPPWERPEFQDVNFFAPYIPEINETMSSSKRKKIISDFLVQNPSIQDRYIVEMVYFEQQSKFIRFSTLFPLTSKGKYNYYSVFGELDFSILNNKGRCGVIVQTGIATDEPNIDFFTTVSRNGNIVSLFDFENKRGIFPGVHRMYRFCLLTLEKAGEYQYPEYAFMLHRIEDRYDIERICVISQSNITLMRPNTNLIPVFRNKSEAALAQRTYSLLPILVNENTNFNPWGFEVTRIFNLGISKVSSETRERENLEKNSGVLSGNFFKLKNDEFFFPIYEAKMMNQYSHRFATYDEVEHHDLINGNPNNPTTVNLSDPNLLVIPRLWMPKNMFDSRTGQKIQQRKWFLSYRDITNANNERTMIACILPKSAPDLTLRVVVSDYSACDASLLLANINAFAFDFFVRQSMTGTHLSDYIIKQVPSTFPSQLNENIRAFILERILELVFTSWDMFPFSQDLFLTCNNDSKNRLIERWKENQCTANLEGIFPSPPQWLLDIYPELVMINEVLISPYIWNDERRFLLRCELDALYGHLYNFSHDEFEYILDTFPIVQHNDEARFGEYRTKRVILEMFDALANDPILDGACTPLAERVSVIQNSGLPQPLQIEKPAIIKPVTPLSGKEKIENKPLKPIHELNEAQPPLFEVKPTGKQVSDSKIIEYHTYRCLDCGKLIPCFSLEDTASLEEHTRNVHQGKDPGYRKLA